MKTIKELRKGFPEKIHNLSSSIKYFAGQNIDYDVFLPTKNINLQRDFVWTLHQKRELIWSILYGRNIPSISLINNIEEKWEVIDGKQRLSAMIDFYNNKFTLEIDGKEYLYKDLPQDYMSEIKRFYFNYNVIYEYQPSIISDEVKINWFKLLNYAGTPQDTEHLSKLEN